MERKKIYKSNVDKRIDGVCGGIADYLNIDATVIRLLWAILVLCAGTGILAYILCAIIIPRNPDSQK